MAKKKNRIKEIHEIIEEQKDTEDQPSMQYPSAYLLLDSARDEYAKERERSKTLDEKAAHFMTAIILVATIFVPVIPFGSMVKAFVDGGCYPKCIMTVFAVTAIGSFLILIMAFRYLYNAYKLQTFLRFESKNLDEEALHKESPDYIARTMCKNYKGIIDYNIEQNGKKAESVTKGLRLCAVGFLLLAISAIGLRFIIGG